MPENGHVITALPYVDVGYLCCAGAHNMTVLPVHMRSLPDIILISFSSSSSMTLVSQQCCFTHGTALLPYMDVGYLCCAGAHNMTVLPVHITNSVYGNSLGF